MSEEISLEELSSCLSTAPDVIQTFIAEGILVAASEPGSYFSPAALARARRALRLQRAFELDVGSLALVLELLDELERLRRRTTRLEAGLQALS